MTMQQKMIIVTHTARCFCEDLINADNGDYDRIKSAIRDQERYARASIVQLDRIKKEKDFLKKTSLIGGYYNLCMNALAAFDILEKWYNSVGYLFQKID